MLEEYPDFYEKFKMVFNNADIPEADGFTPEVLEDKYVDMYIALPRYGEGTKFTKVRKRLQNESAIPIGSYHDNPMLDTIVHEV